MDSKFVQLKGLSLTDIINKINSELTEDICTEQLKDLEIILKERVLKRDKQKIINSELLKEIENLKLKTDNLSNQYKQSQERVLIQERPQTRSQRRQVRNHVPNRGIEQTQTQTQDSLRDRIARDDALRTHQRQRRQNN